MCIPKGNMHWYPPLHCNREEKSTKDKILIDVIETNIPLSVKSHMEPIAHLVTSNIDVRYLLLWHQGVDDENI